jgi:hypothetical protein
MLPPVDSHVGIPSGPKKNRFPGGKRLSLFVRSSRLSALANNDNNESNYAFGAGGDKTVS